jgi:AcrR family transcriptional regulator
MPEPARQPAAGTSTRARPPARAGGRQIRGRSLAERQRERRDAMLVAGLDLFGTKGFATTRVEDVCRRAGVSTRNFYEEFDDRQSLLVAVGEQIVAGVFAVWSDPGGNLPGAGGMSGVGVTGAGTAGRRVAEPGTLRARITKVVHLLVDDPRVARLAFVEAVGVSPSHESLRRDMLRVFPTWLAAYMQGRLDAAGVPTARQHTMAVAAFATAHELIADWALRPPEERLAVDELIDEIMAMGRAIYGVDHFDRPT